MKQTCEKFNRLLFGMLTLLILNACSAEVNEEFPEATPIQKVKFEINFDLAVDPDLLVLTIQTPKGKLKDVRTNLSRESDGKYVSEAFTLGIGDYRVRNWVAYHTGTNFSIAKSQAKEVPFALVEGVNPIVQSGENVKLLTQEIPVNRFSLILPDYYPTINDVVALSGNNRGDLSFFASKQINRYHFAPNLFRINTKGDVRYVVERDLGKRSTPAYLRNTSDDNLIYSYKSSFNPDGAYAALRSHLVIKNDYLNIVDPKDGNYNLQMGIRDVTSQSLNGGLYPSHILSYTHGVEPTSDGGMIAFGAVRTTSLIYDVTKYSSSGVAEWTKNVDLGLGNKISTLSTITPPLAVQKDDRFMIMASSTAYSPYLLHHDASGNLIKTIDFSVLNPDITLNYNYSKIIATDDGGYLLAGTEHGTNFARYVKLNVEGVVQWDVVLDNYADPIYGKGRDAVIVSNGADGSVISALSFAAGGEKFKIYHKIIRLDTRTGQILNETTEPIAGEGIEKKAWNAIYSIAETNEIELGFRGIVCVGKYAPLGESAGHKSIPWIFKIPSTFNFETSEINTPTSIVLP